MFFSQTSEGEKGVDVILTLLHSLTSPSLLSVPVKLLNL